MTGAGLDQARAVADAVLYEGYLLYPYRSSAVKNKVRWQWGVLMPPSYAARNTGEYDSARTELIAEPRAGAMLHVRLRFLRVRARIVEVPDDTRGGAGFRPVPALTVAGVEHTTWDEAVEQEIDAVLGFDQILAGDRLVPVDLAATERIEAIPGGGGARLVRRCQHVTGEMVLDALPLPGPFGGVRLGLSVRNTSTWDEPEADRTRALGPAWIAAHVLLGLSDGHFLSATDPPEWASVVARECRNERLWPVLVGDPDRRDTVLCSPIILYDHPVLAAESPGNLFDSTEIDEILTLRTMTLTDEEKRAARATDPKAAELLDRVDNLPPELLDRLHGTVRYLRAVTGETHESPDAPDTAEIPDVTGPPDRPWWDPGADASVSPETDSVVVDGTTVAKGSRVRLRPARRADAHDMFLAGRTAIVQAVVLDVDGDWHLAVTLEDDIGAELYAAHGRYRYFTPDEVQPL